MRIALACIFTICSFSSFASMCVQDVKLTGVVENYPYRSLKRFDLSSGDGIDKLLSTVSKHKRHQTLKKNIFTAFLNEYNDEIESTSSIIEKLDLSKLEFELKVAKFPIKRKSYSDTKVEGCRLNANAETDIVRRKALIYRSYLDLFEAETPGVKEYLKENNNLEYRHVVDMKYKNKFQVSDTSHTNSLKDCYDSMDDIDNLGIWEQTSLETLTANLYQEINIQLNKLEKYFSVLDKEALKYRYQK